MTAIDTSPAEPAPNVSGDLVRRVRLFHGWTQDGLAALFNVTRRTVIRWEEGGAYMPQEGLDSWNFRARTWAHIHGLFCQARALRMTEDGVTELVTKQREANRLDHVTFRARRPRHGR